jgi:hypothetical protein
MDERQRKEFDSDPLWSPTGQIQWLLRRANQAERPTMRTSEIAEAMRIHKVRVFERLNDLANHGRVVSARQGREIAWSLRKNSVSPDAVPESRPE